MNERIKAVRKFLKLNQSDFGKQLGITPTAISKIENNERNLTEQTILAVCRGFNVSETWLRTGEGEMFSKTKQDFIDELVDGYGLNGIMHSIADAYWKLDKDSRSIVDKFVKNVALAVLGKDVVLISDINIAVSTEIAKAMGSINNTSASSEHESDIIKQTKYAAKTVDGEPLNPPPKIPDLSKYKDRGEPI